MQTVEHTIKLNFLSRAGPKRSFVLETTGNNLILIFTVFFWEVLFCCFLVRVFGFLFFRLPVLSLRRFIDKIISENDILSNTPE